MKLLSKADLVELGITFSRTHLWRLEREGKFPMRVKIATNRHGWPDNEIHDWLKKKAAERYAPKNDDNE